MFFSWLFLVWGSKLASFSYVCGGSVSRSFFDRLGVGFGVDFGSILTLKSDPNRPKNGIEFWIDFRCHAWRKQPTIPGPGTPWGAPQCQRFSEQETSVWARNNNSCSFLGLFLSPFPGMGNFWIHFCKNVHFLITFLHVCNCCNKGTELMIWHALGKARRISCLNKNLHKLTLMALAYMIGIAIIFQGVSD